MSSPGEPLDLPKRNNFYVFDAFWVCGTFGNILTSIVSHSHFGKRPRAQDMTIFGCHIGPHIRNIGYREVYGVCGCMWWYMGVYAGIWRYMDVHGSICTVYEGILGYGTPAA